MSPEDFTNYQVLVAPEPKREKTREQELADRVKSLERLRSQEATHKGQIDKLELDLQRHRDTLQGVLSRKRVESEECDELRAQVVREQAPVTESSLSEAIPLAQCDSQQDQENDMVGQAVSEEMYLSTVDEESGDESMLLGTSQCATARLCVFGRTRDLVKIGTWPFWLKVLVQGKFFFCLRRWLHDSWNVIRMFFVLCCCTCWLIGAQRITNSGDRIRAHCGGRCDEPS